MKNIDIKKMSENGWNFERETWEQDDTSCVYLCNDGRIISGAQTWVDEEDKELIAEMNLCGECSDPEPFFYKEQLDEIPYFSEHRDFLVYVEDNDYYPNPRVVGYEDLKNELPSREEFLNTVIEDILCEEDIESFKESVKEKGAKDAIEDLIFNGEYDIYGYETVLYNCVDSTCVEYTDNYNADLNDLIEKMKWYDMSDFFSYVIEDDSDIKKAYSEVVTEDDDEDEEDDDEYAWA